jgi:OOP family OmpA-OmpF porin
LILPRSLLFALLALLFVQACAGSELSAQVGEVRERLATARDQGAYRCAPRELATGEATVDFAERELDQGDYFAARGHLVVAQAKSKEALRLASDERRCPRARPEPDRTVENPNADRDRDGTPDRVDRCPDEPEDRDGFEDDDGCPDPDNDSDGIPDTVDKCPNQAEDMDGFEDDDGCPDPDNDKDGILDTNDTCPNEPGPASTGGCPEKFEHIAITDQKIELKQAVFFQTGKAVIMPRSFGLLDEAFAALAGRPSMKIRIEGHTDNRGGRPYNLGLSQARADAVKAYLASKGISSDRMEAKGYGPDQPIDDNKSVSGRERNRRVEFMITQQ